jgi:hypothetical protein
VSDFRGKSTRGGEKIRSAALAICRKRGGAITRAKWRKVGRAGQGEGVRRERSRLIRCRAPHKNRRGGARRLAALEGGVSASSAWQLLWWVGAIFCVLAAAWFLVLTVPDEGSPLAWGLALAFGMVCIAAAASLRRLLLEAFVSPGPVSYSSALLVSSLWAFISAVLTAACARVGAAKAARGWAVSFVAFTGVSAYCFWRVL